jgi:murein DD-endopeptidase MepM/ murein hydrolase activator NlpD
LFLTSAARTDGEVTMATYTVRRGDTLTKIARRFHTTVQELVRLNGIANPDRIGAGLEIVVPDGENGTGGVSGIAEPYRQWMPYVLASARKYGLEPALILGIMAVETGGKNVIGDQGHGHGLMQIDDRSHGAWLDSHANGLDPESNIDYACSLLRSNIDRFGGDIRAGVAAYNAGPRGAQRGIDDSGNPDQYTTGGNYSARVLERAAPFRAQLASAGDGNDGDRPGVTESPDQEGAMSTYTVQRGDTLSKIARQFGTTVLEIVRLNQIPDPDRIRVGQELKIPDGRHDGEVQATGRYAFPVQGYSGTVDLHWGSYVGASDLFAPQGTPIVAVCGGVVTYAGTNDRYGGNNVLIHQEDGRDCYYAHGDRPPSVGTGDAVATGTFLFGVGDTGNAAAGQYHLHIGLGYGIQDGSGPTGGAGINFNAVEFLRSLQGGSDGPPPPGPTRQFRVVDVGHLGLNVRVRPSHSAGVLAALDEGDLIVGENTIVEAEGRAWRRVHDPDGWAADRYLAPA